VAIEAMVNTLSNMASDIYSDTTGLAGVAAVNLQIGGADMSIT